MLTTSIPVTDPIPEHLLPYIVAQEPEKYTAIDHAAWRFIMKVARASLSKTAHPNYLSGLEETGITTERIPLISDMDTCLRRYGWRAVGVSGFIPPAIFMEFQSLGILPIACDMRKIENIAYTPSPDIVHEAAGHAPMIANADYADYLRQYGTIAQKAIYSKNDMAVYLAVRALSELKEDPHATEEAILTTEEALMHAEVDAAYTSEGAELARFYWWTVEYGLIGSLQEPLIYGAGLLSSVGEAETCLKPDVIKLPFSLAATRTNYDITRPQPQLFVAGDFKQLGKALQSFARGMAFNKGGLEGLGKARQAETVTTSVLDTGLQISGVLDRILTNPKGEPIYLHTGGPSQLSYNDVQLPGHGATYHAHGYGTVLGRVLLEGQGIALSDFSDADWRALGFDPHADDSNRSTETTGTLVFESGITLTGKLTGKHSQDGRLLIARFSDCHVRFQDSTLFMPDWGHFDLACGEHVVAVFGGPADRTPYLEDTKALHPPKRPQKENRGTLLDPWIPHYQSVRNFREAPNANKLDLDLIATQLLAKPLNEQNWLLAWELLELAQTRELAAAWLADLNTALKGFTEDYPDKAFLINKGIALLS